MVSPKRLEIYYASLEKKQGSVQHGFRPVLIVQNDIGNFYSEAIIVVPLTTSQKKELPTHVVIGQEEGLTERSTVLCEQITTISLYQLEEKIGEVVVEDTAKKIEQALALAIGLKKTYFSKNRKENNNESENEKQ